MPSGKVHLGLFLALACATSSGCVYQGFEKLPGHAIPRPYVRYIWPIDRPSRGSLAFGRITLKEFRDRYSTPLPKQDLGEDPAFAVAYCIKTDVSNFKRPADEGTDLPSRGVVYLFENDVLVGEAFHSSFQTDSTNFDATKVDDIVEGQTTRDEVLALLGPASGCRLCPADALDNPTGLEYLYLSNRRQMKVSMRTWVQWLSVSFDERGVASKVTLRAHYMRWLHRVGSVPAVQPDAEAQPTAESDAEVQAGPTGGESPLAG